MDSIIGYDSSDEQEQSIQTKINTFNMQISCAPVPVVQPNKTLVDMSKENVNIDIMMKPEMGPLNPFVDVMGQRIKRNGGGRVEEAFVEDQYFHKSYHDYISSDNHNIKTSQPKDKQKPKRKLIEINEADLESESPWISEPKLETSITQQQTKVSKKNAHHDEDEDDDENEKKFPSTYSIIEPDREAEKWEKKNERKLAYVLPRRPSRGETIAEATSIFHGNELKDYQGRSWTAIPSECRNYTEEHECYIPKKCVHKYTGHTKGVQAIELIPKTGHLLLSGSMDGKCKIWDVMKDRRELRSYNGHSEGVRSINMSPDGSQFLSASFDRYIRLWDIETGQAVGTFSNRKMNYQVKFYPNDSHIFLCAASDNRIYQWDSRTGSICQEYNYHLQACNTITFFDEGRKFISTSDDKKMLVWEYDIPVPIKYIAEPDMHSIPSLTVHPSGKHLCGQSMDNTIVTYTCGDRINQMKKKTFRGHNNSGYACQIGFSPDGRFMSSGDGHGKLYFWDFKTTKVFRSLHAHDGGPCMSTVWHPLVPSWVFTCGWDGLIKLWD